MSTNKMYSQRVKNIPVMRYCDYRCSYCAFQKFQKISNCQACRKGFNHTHLEVLNRKPPKTKAGEFLTVGLSGDVSFMTIDNFNAVLNYCTWWADRTFLIQSKNPEYFLRVIEPPKHLGIPDNVILGTTIETDSLGLGDYEAEISKAPIPYYRYEAMLKLNCRKAVTIEPVLDFDPDVMVKWITDINPEFVYIGYANDGKQGKRLRLPEPTLEKTLKLIARLREAGIDVREKTIRKAFYE